MATAELTARPGPSARRAALKAELRDVERELVRYAEAIGKTGPVPALLEAVETRERRRAAVAGELAQLSPPRARRPRWMMLRCRRSSAASVPSGEACYRRIRQSRSASSDNFSRSG